MQGTRFFLRQTVACQPDGVATIAGARKRTWREVGEPVPRLPAALRAFGIENGAFVAALGFNSDRYGELFFAVPWAGGAFAPPNVRWSPFARSSLGGAGTQELEAKIRRGLAACGGSDPRLCRAS